MRSTKGLIIGLGLAASAFMSTPHASASELAMIADASGSDNRGQFLLIVVTPAGPSLGPLQYSTTGLEPDQQDEVRVIYIIILWG
jgi:hypothetical protein